MKVLCAWLGTADTNASTSRDGQDVGPIAQVLDERTFDRLVLLADQPKEKVERYVEWLGGKTDCEIDLEKVELSGPTNFGEIYTAATTALDKRLGKQEIKPELTFHLSPGTPAMAAVWIILGKTRYAAELIESSKQHGVKTASVPLDISAEFIPDLIRGADEQLIEASKETPPTAAEFGDIIYRSRLMDRIIWKAQRAAVRNVPILIQGETGTGKELLAHAIIKVSPRKDAPVKVINCGAIPFELVESELFGHVKGAFTGAVKDRKGFFEGADGGTLILDEIGELPKSAQVKLLRVLQEGEVIRVGSTEPIEVDVRVIAITNRDLIEEVVEGRFREDLFYRLAVIVLRIPPLRERQGDLTPLVEGLLGRINRESASEPGYIDKKLSVSAKNILINHSWPGNVRELQNTLRRAAVWSEGKTITEQDAKESLMPVVERLARGDQILGRDIEQGVDLQELIGLVVKHYLPRAMEQSAGNKSKAAKLLGLPTYQTLTNWLRKYGIE